MSSEGKEGGVEDVGVAEEVEIEPVAAAAGAGTGSSDGGDRPAAIGALSDLTSVSEAGKKTKEVENAEERGEDVEVVCCVVCCVVCWVVRVRFLDGMRRDEGVVPVPLLN